MRISTHRYGELEGQEGDFYRPDGAPRAVVALLHGGFWCMPYGRDQMEGLAEALADDGFAVWNFEYRRLGGGGGWPATFLDVAAGIDFLADLAPGGPRVVVAGHSAGGHLALWSAGRARFPGVAPSRVRISAVAGLAPVTDLAATSRLPGGREPVEAMLGGPMLGGGVDPGRLSLASPCHMLPLGLAQLVVHGDADEMLPAPFSRAYADAAEAAGDAVTYVEVPDAGHMDFLEPARPATLAFRAWLEGLFPCVA